MPSALWKSSTPVRPHGIGQWVYLAQNSPPGPGQLPTTGYLYGPSFFAEGVRGIVALSRDDRGPIAGIQLVGSSPDRAPVTIRYDWSPGKFYFVFAYHLGGGRWGGWVYDHAGAVWTYIGEVQAPSSGLLGNSSHSVVLGAQGAPAAPFAQGGPAITQPCSAFPRVDAYLYPPFVYWGTTYSMATFDSISRFPGDCPTGATLEYDWFHLRLGSLPGGS